MQKPSSRTTTKRSELKGVWRALGNPKLVAKLKPEELRLLGGKRPARFKDLTGMRFGRLTAVSIHSRVSKTTRWNCVCECGNKTVKKYAMLIIGHVRSCGCLFRDTRKTCSLTHGDSKSKEHGAWADMKGRCNNPKRKCWKHYGGRGIKVCEEWNHYAGFLKSVGRAPSPLHEIDRIDNNGNYEPGNVRWATRMEQTNNTRRNHYITHKGKTKSMADWCRDLKKNYFRVRYLIKKGLTFQRAIST